MLARKFLTSCLLFTAPACLFSSTPTTDSTLNTAIIAANSTPDKTINFQNSITLTPAISPLLRPFNTDNTFSAIAQTITVNGNGFTLNGSNAFRGFFVMGGTVIVNNLTFQNTRAIGGAGRGFVFGGAGGGGAGLGGAVYVRNGSTVTLNNVSFVSSNATGGSGGGSDGTGGFGGAGGGGLTGSGGTVTGFDGGSGGGGFAFAGGPAGADGPGGGGGATNSAGIVNDPNGGNGGTNWAGNAGGMGAADNSGLPGQDGPTTGTGGGGGGDSLATGGKGGNGNTGGGGGGGGSSVGTSGVGGTGGIYAGGGGGGVGINPGAGGDGGFAGGGGGAGANASGPGTPANGGKGGFGAGGGGGGDSITSGSFGLGGAGGFGGGNGGNGVGDPVSARGGGGGAGAGFGGAIFIETGGMLNINGSASFQSDTVTAGASGGAGATAGTAAGADIFMRGGASVNFNLTSSVTIPNPIESDHVVAGGGLTVSGSGLLKLTGANTYTGLTTVSSGALQIDGSIVTDIQNSGTVTGIFSMPGTLTNNGVVSPGDNGVGQITVGSFVNSGTLQININPMLSPANSSINVGPSTLGGTLVAVLQQGNYIAGTRFVVVNGPTTGAFANFNQTGPAGPFVNLALTYDGAILTVLQHSFFRHQIINPGIPTAVANCINNADIVIGSQFANFVIALGALDNATLNQVLGDLSPVNYGALDLINARNNSFLTKILSEHLYELKCRPCQRNRLWIDFYGNSIRNHRYDNLNSFRATGAGVIGGYDFSFSNWFDLGAAGGYTYDWLRHDSSSQSYYGALYSGLRLGCFDIDLSGIGGVSDYNLKRKISFFDLTPKSHPKAIFATGHLGLDYRWDWCGKILEPYVLADYHYFHRKSFQESNVGGIGLSVQSHKQNMLIGEAGLKFYRIWDCACFYAAPYLGVSWVEEYPLGKSHQRASFIGQSCVINTVAFHSRLSYISPQFGVKWTQDCGFSLLINYKGLFNKKVMINEADIRLERVF